MNAINPVKIWKFFITEETRSSSLLLFAGILGLVLANSFLSTYYFGALQHELTFGFVTLDIQHWINEGLMAIFFLVVGLEVKRELIDGELRGWKKASFPVFGAIGGMLLPAFIFAVFNPTLPESRGWAIPMATDIAIAVGVLGLLGNKISRSLRVFLLTLAIVDDIGSIIIIALFYAQPDNTISLLVALLAVLVLAAIRNNRYWMMWFGVIGIIFWYLLIISGIPGTLAGVVVAFLAPLSTRRKNSKKLQLSEIAEDILIPLSAFVVVPLFVLANAGVQIGSISLNDKSAFNVFIGIFVGLLFGKAVGIFCATRVAVSLGLTKKPKDMSWNQITGVGFVAGIGFTISLLIANLAYDKYDTLQNAATIGIFSASIISGIIGLILLSKFTSNKKK